MAITLRHRKLDTVFHGAEDSRHRAIVHHFRGIQYAQITERFAVAVKTDWYPDTVDATKYGPQCPQMKVDVGHLLRLPKEHRGMEIPEDEFRCLNANITCPPYKANCGPLPVLVWLHGGSQVVTFASAASPVCDPTRMVADSIEQGKSIIVVTANYRLNVFAFGDGTGSVNLALKDQRTLFDWVVENIRDFGGDPLNITLAGESAGAVYCHAHIVTGAPVHRVVLASGSLYLSPPLPLSAGKAMLKRVLAKLSSGKNLRTASAPELVHAITECGINSMWLQEEPGLLDWDQRDAFPQPLMIGDVEFESVLWQQGIEFMTAEEISMCFKHDSASGSNLDVLYRAEVSRPRQSKHAALDFLNDWKFGLPVHSMCRKRRQQGAPTYRYSFDEHNPWQSSSRAHHAVDLIMLFGGVDLDFNQGAKTVGQWLRNAWIVFANGGKPWSPGMDFGFGPYGRCATLTDEEYRLRRRVICYERLEELGQNIYGPVGAKLATGRISLLT